MHDRRPHPQLGSPAAGGVDVWRVDLRLVGERPLQGLSAAEHQRARAIVGTGRRALWLRGRGVLRVLLGAYLQRPPRAIELLQGPHGKPALADAPGPRGRPRLADAAAESGDSAPPRSVEARDSHPPLHFNLSHSGPLALYAFTVAAPLGVDVELGPARPLDEVALAERTLGAAAAQRLRALHAPARRREFLRLWVRHEAVLKCLGRGLTGSPPATEAEISRLWIAELDLGPDIAAALALQGGPHELRLHEWPAAGEPMPVM